MSAVQRQRARRAAMIRERLSTPALTASKQQSAAHQLEGLLRTRPHDEDALKRELQKKRILPADGTIIIIIIIIIAPFDDRLSL